MMDPSAVYQLARDARYRRVAGEGVVRQQTAAEILMLNDTGSDVLELIDGERSVRDIVAATSSDYRADPEVISQDVRIYIGQLVEVGVISKKTPEMAA